MWMDTWLRSQSAMEYLTTYGWAILVIAVVIVVLFALGVFSSNTFTPKAGPGVCDVQRPLGPGTTRLISLQGMCGGEQPQAVAVFTDTQGSISVPASSLLNLKVPYTIAFWFNKKNYLSSCDSLIGKSSCSAMCIYTLTASGCSAGSDQSEPLTFRYTDSLGGVHDGLTSGISVPSSTWVFAAITIDNSGGTSGLIKWYINGTETNHYTWTTSFALNTNSLTIGGGDHTFNGSMANVQLYNTALGANSIAELYREGIGGAPVSLTNLLGWWPLNGNPVDYSGEGLNGTAANTVSYVDNWQSGYSSP